VPFCCDIYGHVEVSVRLPTVSIAMLCIFAIALNTSTIVPDEGFRRDGAWARQVPEKEAGQSRSLKATTKHVYQLLRGRANDC